MGVNQGSPSEQCGLKSGDVLLEINGHQAGTMTHKQAQDAIVSSGDRVCLVVQRWVSQDSQTAPAPGVWKPNVELVGGPATSPAPPGTTYTKTSLQLAQPPPEDSHWDVKHNQTAKAFNPGQTTPGFRSVSAPVTKPGAETNPAGQAPKLQVCWMCTQPIMGVFLQIKGRPTHADCFVCFSCKSSLKNVGHISVGDKMMCEICAKKALGQSQPQPGPQAPPQGLAANLAKLAVKPESGCVPPPTSGNQASTEWDQKLNSDQAGMAANAEDFTKEFMKQLTGGH